VPGCPQWRTRDFRMGGVDCRGAAGTEGPLSTGERWEPKGASAGARELEAPPSRGRGASQRPLSEPQRGPFPPLRDPSGASQLYLGPQIRPVTRGVGAGGRLPVRRQKGQKVCLFWSVDSQEIIKIVATRCHILRLECTKFDSGWVPAGRAFIASQDSWISGAYF